MEFDPRHGLAVFTGDGQGLPPGLLSSGEKQLLLLLCHTVSCSDRPTLLLLDEPELSLNIKWQRKLISALRTLTEGLPVQFVLATHSIELLTHYEAQVVKLESR